MGDRAVDEELVARAKRGDKRAFDLLVLKYQHKVTNLVSRYVRDPNEALDVTQEAFIKAYRALDNFRGDSAFYTWLYRIAINTAKNLLVAQNRRPPDTDLDSEVAEQLDVGVRLKEHATPESHLFEREIAITLRELEGLSYEEIANAMSCPIGTVRSRIFRAREAIDAKLQPLLSND